MFRFPRFARGKDKRVSHLNLDSMSVPECSLKFAQLSCYTLKMVADIQTRMSLFVLSVKERRQDNYVDRGCRPRKSYDPCKTS